MITICIINQVGHYHHIQISYCILHGLNFKGGSSVNNKTLEALPPHLHESIATAPGDVAQGESHDKHSPQLRLMLYLPLNSHHKLYIAYKLVAVL